MKLTSIIKKILWIALFFPPLSINAQQKEEDPEFFTGISPVILQRNAVEIASINGLNSLWLAQSRFNPTTQIIQVANRQRFTRVENLLRVTYGFSKNKNWDLGLEVKYAHARLDEAARSSPFRVFQGKIEESNEDFALNNSYHGLSTIGFRARVMPFSAMPELTVQLTHTQPMAAKASDRYALGAQRATTGLGATYFVQSGENIYYFFQAEWLVSHKSSYKNFNGNDPSLGAYMVIRTWGNQWYIFPGLNYSASLSGSFFLLQNRFFGSLGAMYQPSPKFSVILNAQMPFIMDSGNRYIEFVKSSYTGISIGLRSLLQPR